MASNIETINQRRSRNMWCLSKQEGIILKNTPMRKWSAFPNSNPDQNMFIPGWTPTLVLYLHVNRLHGLQASALAFDDNIIFCNVVVWMIALGLESRRRTDDPDLCPKLLSTPLRLNRRYSQVRRRVSRAELTSRITPVMISSLYTEKVLHK